MHGPTLIEFYVMGTASVLGAARYLQVRYRTAATLGIHDAIPASQSAACAWGVVAGLHLIVCGFVPAALTHLSDAHGGHVDLETLWLSEAANYVHANVSMGMEVHHRGHVIWGGILSAVIAASGLLSLYKSAGASAGPVPPLVGH